MKKIFFMASCCNSIGCMSIRIELQSERVKCLVPTARCFIWKPRHWKVLFPLDSVKLEGDGSFHFKQVRPVSPEFYRLRVDDKVINFSVDSTETVLVKAPYTDFATAYTVEGSPNSSKIKDLTLKQMKLQDNVNALLQSVQAQ